MEEQNVEGANVEEKNIQYRITRDEKKSYLAKMLAMLWTRMVHFSSSVQLECLVLEKVLTRVL